MTGVSFTLLICNKAYKLFYLTLDRRVITQLRLYALTLHDVCYVGMYVCQYVKEVTELKIRTASY